METVGRPADPDTAARPCGCARPRANGGHIDPGRPAQGQRPGSLGVKCETEFLLGKTAISFIVVHLSR